MPLGTILEPVYAITRWTSLLYNLLAPKVLETLFRHPDLALGLNGFLQRWGGSSGLTYQNQSSFS